MDYLLDVNAAREEHVHELAVGGTRAQLLNFRIPRITTFINYDTVEIPDPKGLSTFSQCTEFLSHRGFELMSSRCGVSRSSLNG
jgi:hypothetical protein